MKQRREQKFSFPSKPYTPKTWNCNILCLALSSKVVLLYALHNISLKTDFVRSKLWGWATVFYIDLLDYIRISNANIYATFIDGLIYLIYSKNTWFCHWLIQMYSLTQQIWEFQYLEEFACKIAWCDENG